MSGASTFLNRSHIALNIQKDHMVVHQQLRLERVLLIIAKQDRLNEH